MGNLATFSVDTKKNILEKHLKYELPAQLQDCVMFNVSLFVSWVLEFFCKIRSKNVLCLKKDGHFTEHVSVIIIHRI